MKKVATFLMLLSFVSICNAEYAYPDNPDARPYIGLNYEHKFLTGTNTAALGPDILFTQPVDEQVDRVSLDMCKPLFSDVSFLSTITYEQSSEVFAQTRMNHDHNWIVNSSDIKKDGFAFKVGVRYYFPIGY